MFGALLAIGRTSLNQLACEGQPINFRLAPTADQQIWGDHSLSQIFVAAQSGLNRIDVMFETYQRQNTHDINLRLLELEPGTNDPLSGLEQLNLSFNAATLQDRAWRSFSFDPIPDSAGKSYAIVLQSSESIPGNAVSVGGIEWDVYAPGLTFFDNVPLRADIAFRSCYQLSAVEKIEILSVQITQHRPALWGNVLFYRLVLFIYAALLIGLFWKLAKLAL